MVERSRVVERAHAWEFPAREFQLAAGVKTGDHVPLSVIITQMSTAFLHRRLEVTLGKKQHEFWLLAGREHCGCFGKSACGDGMFAAQPIRQKRVIASMSSPGDI